MNPMTVAAQRMPFVVTEVTLDGREHEFAACADPFTAGRVRDDLARRIGRWGSAQVRLFANEDVRFDEDEQGVAFLEGLSDEEFAAFVARVGVVFTGGTRWVALNDFYSQFYGGTVSAEALAQ